MRRERTWGGYRLGSGRKPLNYRRTVHTFRLTDDEYWEIKPIVDAIRERTNREYELEMERQSR